MSGPVKPVTPKWRPPLALVIGGTLAAVLVLPLFGIIYLRLWGNILGWGEAAWLIVWLAVIATSVLGFLLWRLVLRPIYALTNYARAMKAGQTAPVPVHFGTPELSTLGASVTAMGESLNSRAEGMKAYADHVTHELTSPLTAIRGASELLQAGASGKDAEDLTNTIREASARMQMLLDDLGHHTRAANSAGTGTCQLSAVAQDINAGLILEVAQDGDIPLLAADLTTILTQVARNAAEHGAQKLTLTASGSALHIADDGPGISAGNRDRIFDPFFTTRREQGGTGMGLSIVRSLVQARGGRVSLLTEGPGAQFLISFD
ncbi:HAMP domain-containing sensor histidine kinase [Tateyamaria sp. Alg231-49]|uniref:sensor histidine kinase n=1 Tax=Tateyamaria sp. Alg231-49 TaxID=1922219 RepID=UPI000D5518E5|nr:ATP-binding protein [Tateyamaria sp. Alg231-49]